MKLTNREREVVDCLVDGLSNKDTAEKLYVSKTTIKTHIQNIYKKFGVKSRVELLVKIYKKKLNEVTNE